MTVDPATVGMVVTALAGTPAVAVFMGNVKSIARSMERGVRLLERVRVVHVEVLDEAPPSAK